MTHTAGGQGHNIAADLRAIVTEARPLVEQWLDLAEQFGGLREAATRRGLDWGQIKALVKAQVQDERDGGDGKRVNRIIEKADFASSYADILGLGSAKLNENNSFVEVVGQALPAPEGAADAIAAWDARRQAELDQPIYEDRPAASGDSAEASASEGYSAATEAPLDSRSRTSRRNGGVGSVEPAPAERSPNPGQEITPAPARVSTADLRRAARSNSDDLEIPGFLRRTA